MATKTTPPREEKNNNFGLPQTEFKPLPRRKRGLSIAIILVLIILAIGGGVYWFFTHSPATPFEETYPTYEQTPSETLPTQTDGNEVSKSELDFTNNEAYRTSAAVKNAVTAQEFSKKLQQKRKGTIKKISEPQGFYYLVVGSFIDGDLASDYAHRLASQGVDTMILAPERGDYFFRVAVSKADSLYNAHQTLDELKPSYKNNMWVKQY